MKVQHPTFPDVVQDVTDAEPWIEQGWVKYSEAAPKPAAEATPRPRRRSSRQRGPAPAKPTTGVPAGDTEAVTTTPKTKEASDGE